MPEKKGYEIIRFVERGTNCYASTDYVKGTTLYQWIQENTVIEKEKLYRWLGDISKQLSLYQKQHGNPQYQFLNPYNIIITETDKIVLVSTDDARKNQNRFVEKHFTPLSEQQDCDVYCMGKIIQFIMAHIRCEPSLNKKEEYKLLKIVRKCLETESENQYKNIQTVHNYLLKKKREKWKFPEFKRNQKLGIIAAVILLIAAGYHIWRDSNVTLAQTAEITAEKELGEYQEEQREEPKEEQEEQPEELKEEQSKQSEEQGKAAEQEETVTKTDNSQYFDMGLSYFLELKDYQKSRECMEKVESQEEKAKYYKVLADFMVSGQENNDLETALEILRMRIMQEEETDVRELLILIRVYIKLDREESYKTVIELSKKVNIETQWKSLAEEVKENFAKIRRRHMKNWRSGRR